MICFTYRQAQEHWLTFGMAEGRQACGEFHCLQYFERYPIIARQLNNNCTLGVMNYVLVGLLQGLVGVVDGGAYDR